MYTQKTYSLTDIANKIGNWYFNLNVIQQAVVLIGVGLLLREIAPKNYYYSAPKPVSILLPMPRKDFSESTKKYTKFMQGYLCNNCKTRPIHWEFHHKDDNRSNNSPSNCEGLCLDCHAEKHRKPKFLR